MMEKVVEQVDGVTVETYEDCGPARVGSNDLADLAAQGFISAERLA